LFYVLARVVKDVSNLSGLQHPTTYIIFFHQCASVKRISYSLLLFHQHVNERLHQYHSDLRPL